MLSIILPQYILDNEILDIAKRNLESIKKYTDVPYEIIAIDNGSPVHKDWIAENFDNLIVNVRNMGNGYAWDQGLKKAKGDYLCLMDNDVFLSENWIKPLLEELKDPKVGIIFPLSKNKEDDTYKVRMTGFCWTMRRDVYEKVGGIDYINFPLGNFEDDDYFRRTMDAGYILKCTQNSKITHHSRATCDKIDDIKKIWHSNRENYVKKHNNQWAELTYG